MAVTDYSGMSSWTNQATPQIGGGLQSLNQYDASNQMGQLAQTNTIGTGLGTQGGSTGGGWFNQQSAFGGTDSFGNQTSGWVSPALGAASGLAQSWLGFQNLGVAKDQLSFQKSAWQEQFNIQKEEFEYQKQRRQERMDNYNASQGNQSSAAASPNSL